MNPLELFLVLAFAAQALSYTLPDIGINQEIADCKNANQLYEMAQNDLIHLNCIIKSLEDSLSVLTQISSLVGQVCGGQIYVKPLKFIQVNIKAKDKSSFQLRTKIFSQIAKIKEIQDKVAREPIFDEIVHSKVDKIINQIIVASAQSHEEQNSQTCKGLNTAIEELQDYLRWAINEISTEWINDYLAFRITNLEAMKNQQWVCTKVFLPKSAAKITYSSIWDYGSDISNIMDPNSEGFGWNSGAYPTGWIQFTFSQPTYVETVKLVVDTILNCNIVFYLIGDFGLDTKKVIAAVDQYLSEDQVLELTVKAAFTNFRIITTKAQSWVGWKKVVFYTGDQNCKCI
jgi:hypothetical protein